MNNQKRKNQLNDQISNKKKKMTQSKSNLLNLLGTLLRNCVSAFGEVGMGLEAMIPLLVFIGNQSAGKTTLFKRIVSIMCPGLPELSLITGNGKSTNFPFEFRFMHKQNIKDNYFHIWCNGEKTICNTMEEMISLVQSYNDNVLSPTNDVTMVAHFEIPDDLSEFTLIDLPGLIIPDGENNTLAEHFRNLVLKYAQKPNAVVLHAISLKEDLAGTCHSIGVLSTIKSIKQIYIGTKLDTLNDSEEIEYNLNFLKEKANGNNSKICLTAATLDQDRECLTISQKVTNREKINVGTKWICQFIPEIVELFINERIGQIIPQLQQLNNFCSKKLEKIGYNPKEPFQISHKYIESIKELSNNLLTKERAEINPIVDEYVFKKETFKKEYIDTIDDLKQEIDDKIKNSINKRGKDFKDLVSINNPVYEIVISKKDEMNNFFRNNFIKKINLALESIIDQTLENLNSDFPECQTINKILEMKWKTDLKKVCDQFESDMIEKINSQHENPSDINDGSCHFEKQLITAFIKTAKKSVKSDYHITFEELEHQLNLPIFNETQVAKCNSVKAFAKKVLSENVDKHFTTISSDFKELTDHIEKMMQEETPKICHQNINTIKENSEIENTRRVLKEAQEIISELTN